MRTIVTGLFAVAACINVGSAQAQEACAEISEPEKRLACYDAEVRPTQSRVSTEARGRWTIERDKSAMDDSVTVWATLLPESVDFSGIGDGGGQLVIRCSENTTAFFLSTNMFMSEEAPSVSYRVDEKPAVKTNWNRSSSYKAIGLWRGGQSIPFLKGLSEAKKLTVRVQERDRLQMSFDLTGIQGALKEVSAACNWG